MVLTLVGYRALKGPALRERPRPWKPPSHSGPRGGMDRRGCLHVYPRSPVQPAGPEAPSRLPARYELGLPTQPSSPDACAGLREAATQR